MTVFMCTVVIAEDVFFFLRKYKLFSVWIDRSIDIYKLKETNSDSLCQKYI